MNKNILDIGAWIGTTVLYQADKFKQVFCVEADSEALKELRSNVNLNELTNIVIIVPKALYKTTGTVRFGPNTQFGDELNLSTSQIKQEDASGANEVQSDVVESICLFDLIQEYKIDNLALIKCDIEGGEEAIMEDLLNYCLKEKVCCYLSFHYDWWSDRNIERFDSLFSRFKSPLVEGSVCSLIKKAPFESFLFEPL